MPKRDDLKKILVIGSGPILIGQAAEFDYAGTQACIALKEEGYEVILINSNPATIMTDSNMADKVYMEPLTLEYVSRIIRLERPDAVVPGLGGQTGLNLVMQLHKQGILDECQVEILGTSIQSIQKAEDREHFKNMCQSINEPVIDSMIASTMEEGIQGAKEIGYPVVLRPAFTLGGTGGGFADNEEQFKEIMKHALVLSPVNQVLVEKSIRGYQEIEFEVMRDKSNTAIAICDMENMDPVGIHTGDSIVFAPCLTLTEQQRSTLKKSALKIIQELKIEGGCNVQFALEPNTCNYYLIEVNPRVSRSSALASKATAYPIARVTAKIAVGYTLEEIDLCSISAKIEPSIDYIVAKVARFPFDKFQNANNTLSTQMKATGEVMSLGQSVEECLLKAIRGLESGASYPILSKFSEMTKEEILSYIEIPTDDRIFALFEAVRKGCTVAEIANQTKIVEFFITKIMNIVQFEEICRNAPNDLSILRKAKEFSLSDQFIAQCWNSSEDDVRNKRFEHDIVPSYCIVDNALHKQDYIPYFYSTYSKQTENKISDKKKILVLGSGPIRIGQGVEFDYSTVHAVWAIKECGFEAIIMNNNPETLSTDYTIADKLYFEPLTIEDVMNVVHEEKPEGVLVTLGGQTAINLAHSLSKNGVPLIGTSTEAIDNAENRDLFEKCLHKLNIPQPLGKAVTTINDGLSCAKEIGYPVLVRPSYVLGGRAMQIVNNDEQCLAYLQTAVAISQDQPVLVDKYIIGKECEVDAICDGVDVFIPGIMEHVEETGVHSGDSISVYPPFSLSNKVKETIIDYTTKLGLGLGIIGLFNIQFIVDQNQQVYIIEVNPRSSRSVPFLSKVTKTPMAMIATKVMLNHSLQSQGYSSSIKSEPTTWYVKAPTFSYAKIKGLDAVLSPEMKSTGEAIGYDKNMNRAFYKALQASGTTVSSSGTLLVTIADKDKAKALPLIERFYKLGFNIEATYGTAEFLKQNGIKTRLREKISEGSNQILESIQNGHITYVINTVSHETTTAQHDGVEIRKAAIEQGITIFTSLSTVNVLLHVLEEITVGVKPIF